MTEVWAKNLCCTFPGTWGINQLLVFQTWNSSPGFPLGWRARSLGTLPLNQGISVLPNYVSHVSWMSPSECQEMLMDKEKGEKAKFGILRLCCRPGTDKCSFYYFLHNVLELAMARAQTSPLCTDQPDTCPAWLGTVLSLRWDPIQMTEAQYQQLFLPNIAPWPCGILFPLWAGWQGWA